MMKPYIAFSRAAGPSKGAILVIANTAKQARVLAYRSDECWNDDGWIDLAVRWLRGEYIMDLANQAKLAAGEPHVVAEPLHCESCQTWGYEVHAGGVCSGCGGYVGDALAGLGKVNLKDS